ncbi:excinuclease ABC subunit A [Sagittula sp. SSi028]|uniref:excinuclease ABC subunit A n=1 Tax=Sagittula sp. SSi028 TaxID=3400636 RepID=UPI003AF91276
MFRILTAAAVAASTLMLPMQASAANNGCPPGLAKKHNGCQAPGQAKKQDDRRDYDRRDYSRGDRLPDTYVIIQNPERYGLRRDRTYYRNGDQVYQVDKDTRKVLAVIGAIAALAD